MSSSQTSDGSLFDARWSGYSAIVYTTRPFPLTLRPGTTTQINAAVGAVPEPATMVLLGTGLLGLVGIRRRHNIDDDQLDS